MLLLGRRRAALVYAAAGLHPHYAGYEIMARVLNKAARANGLRL